MVYPGASINFSLVAIGKYPETRGGNGLLAWDYLNPDIGYETFTDARDGRKYKYVRIGDLDWMAENMNYAGNGSVCLNNLPSLCAKYGHLYTPSVSVCPAGWRLPSKKDFDDLVALAGGESFSASNLKSLYDWPQSQSGNPQTTDKFGFSAAPAGDADVDGNANSMGSEAYFWGQRTEEDDTYHYYMKIDYSNKGAQVGQDFVDYGLKRSIRCVRGSIYDQAKNTLKDLRDDRVYKTVVIGSQTWMAQNLNYNYPANSDISIIVCQNSDTTCGDTIGRVYTWDAAMDHYGLFSLNGVGCKFKPANTCNPTYPVRGICPDGWHLPDTTDWRLLFNAVGGIEQAAFELKSQTGWSTNGHDGFGFCAYPVINPFTGATQNKAYFWTSTKGAKEGRVIRLDKSEQAFILEEDTEDVGDYFSIRCVKD